jgi:hypothetical protein
LSVDDFKEQNKCFPLEKKSNLPVDFVLVLVVPGLLPPVDTEVVPVTKGTVPGLSGLRDTVVGWLVVGSPGTVVVPDTVVDPRVDLLTSETVVVFTCKVVLFGTVVVTVVVTGEVPIVPVANK